MAAGTKDQGSVVTIGNFDGVHLGHQQIIQECIRQARSRGLRALAFTFRPHPQSVLRPDRAPSLLLEYDEKREVLLSLGVDEVVEQGFDASFAETTAEDFFRAILRERLDARAIVVGYDFSFGRGRTGHLQILESLCASEGVTLTVVPPQRVGAEVVSSSVIRTHLDSGRLSEATAGMGRPFFYTGVVRQGDQRGRVMGFPTANLAVEPGSGRKLVLPFGVYATRLTTDGLERVAGVTNVGIRPTFARADGGLAPVLVETHVLEGTHDLYGREVRVEFLARIRGEQRFSSMAELQAQISADIARARQILV
jgi:riboflavin kinase/FMN adenylyltransferase